MKILIPVLASLVLVSGFMAQSVAFAFSAQAHISEQEKMLNVPLEKGGFDNLLTKEDLQELQNIIDEKGQAGGDHRNNGSHDPTELEKRLKQKGWPPKKIAAAKNALQIHVLQDIASSKVGERINGHEVTRLDKLRAKYSLWKIRHRWGYKPIKKYSQIGPYYSGSGEYKYSIAFKDNQSKILNALKRVANWFKVVIEDNISKVSRLFNQIKNVVEDNLLRISRFFKNITERSKSFITDKGRIETIKEAIVDKVSRITTAIKNIYNRILYKFISNPKVRKPGARPIIIRIPADQNPSTFSRVMRTASKWAIVISILYEGYSVTKEVYLMKMAGEKVHPSRVVARACFGFAGAIGGGIGLGAALFWIPVAGPIIGGLAGGLLGAILSEQLFELIMPLHTADWLWAPLDFMIGGILGSLLGFIFGIPYGIRRGFKDIKPRKIIEWILLPIRFLNCVLKYTVRGVLCGGLSGSMLMLIVFTFI